ncbi:MAG: hypothetical protein JST12_00790 [Armatimonadetes bacterium]|nr:hypothetical protein [Armatimonadota bacterium]
MVRRLALLGLLACAVVGCGSGDEGNAEAMHLNAPTVKAKGNVTDQQARNMSEETTRNMGEKNIGESR